jgi:tetratricopeptide (TPR) repeat protein/predicted Ser/Thr protein kinase
MTGCWSDDQIEEAARAGGGDAQHLQECIHCRERFEEARNELLLLDELRATVPRRRGEPDQNALVPGYRIEREIHRGGQGIVYRAVQETTKRVVALKVLLGGRDATRRELRRFEREIELVSRLDHPGIVTLYDSGVSDRTPWCAMEFVDGLRLDEWVRQRKPTSREKIELVRHIATAVAHAHHRGVIHRDLKPANVLVDPHGNPHVLDFGAAFADANALERLRMTAPGEFLGTLAYAAPEQLLGRPRAVDTRTDVHALGTVLYELLTGRLPFEGGGGLAELAERVTTRPPLPASAHGSGTDRDLDAILLKALATEPGDRYGSAEAFASDLARYLAHEPVEAQRHSLAYVLRKHLARRRRPLAAAIGLASIGAALAFAWFREHRRAEHHMEQAALVRSVVQDLLAAPAPQHMGGDARLLDVYEVLAHDLDTALERAPDVQAEVELTIGDTYRRLLRAPEAEPHLQRALARFREIDDGRGLEVARAANALALALAASSRPEAITVATEALGIRERELPGGDPRVAESRRTLATALLHQFRDVDVPRARSLLDRALADQRATWGEESPEVAETKILRARTGEDLPAAAAEDLLSGALATLERPESRDPRALDALTSYAGFLQKQQRFDEARVLLDRAGVLAHRLFGNALACDMLRRQARLEFARGQFQSSELLSRQAVARELERWASMRTDVGESLRALARRIEQPGPPASEPPFAEAFAELRALEGDGAFELAQWMNGISLVLRALQRGAATEPILREALHIRCRALGPDCPFRCRTIELLASELADQHRGGEAVALLEESVATFERVHETATPEAERARELLGRCRGQAEEATGR